MAQAMGRRLLHFRETLLKVEGELQCDAEGTDGAVPLWIASSVSEIQCPGLYLHRPFQDLLASMSTEDIIHEDQANLVGPDELLPHEESLTQTPILGHFLIYQCTRLNLYKTHIFGDRLCAIGSIQSGALFAKSNSFNLGLHIFSSEPK